MHYDPVKNVFAGILRSVPSSRVAFYKLLDLMFLRSWYVRRELRALRKKFGIGQMSILDAGSGYGQYTYFMAKNMTPAIIDAIDVKEDWVSDCKEFFASKNYANVTFSIGDLTKLNVENRYDLIVCVDVMEHIVEDEQVFANYAKALRKGGFVVINTPSIFGGSDVHDDEDESFIGEHARDGYSHTDLEEKLSRQGLKTYQYKYTYGFWGDKAWRLGIKYPIMLANISKLLILILPVYFLVTFLFTFIMMEIDYRSKNEVGSGINFIAVKEN